MSNEKEPIDDEVSDEEEEEVVEPTEPEEITDLSNSDVTTKYLESAKITNLSLTGLIPLCIPGASILELCIFGETVITASLKKVYSGKDKSGKPVEKGLAFPVCLSVNEVICNFSPLNSEVVEPLKAGDIVKIDLGCHIDGYITVSAHTLIVPSAEASPVVVPEGDIGVTIGDVTQCAYNAMMCAINQIKVGNKNTDVTKAVQNVCKIYGVTAISNMRMHQMKRFVIDGKKEIALRGLEKDEEKVEECTFEANEVYAIDIAISSGEGKGRESGKRTTIYKRNVDCQYRLKMKSSRTVLNEINEKFPTMPFTMRMIEDEKVAKMGLAECVTHNLVSQYPVFFEKPGAVVAQFKTTVLLLPSGTVRCTGLPCPEYFKSEKVLAEEEAAMVAEVVKAEEEKKAKADKKKKNKKNKKA